MNDTDMRNLAKEIMQGRLFIGPGGYDIKFLSKNNTYWFWLIYPDGTDEGYYKLPLSYSIVDFVSRHANDESSPYVWKAENRKK